MAVTDGWRAIARSNSCIEWRFQADRWIGALSSRKELSTENGPIGPFSPDCIPPAARSVGDLPTHESVTAVLSQGCRAQRRERRRAHTEKRSGNVEIFLNGDFLDEREAMISPFDHGFLYGDGVFEGMRIYHGRLFRAGQHAARIKKGLQMLCLESQTGVEELLNSVCELARRNHISHEGYVRLVISRGVGVRSTVQSDGQEVDVPDLGLDPKKCPRATELIIVSRIRLYPQEWYEKGLKLVTTAIRRNAPDACPPQVKSLNYLSNVLAKLDANRQDAAEAVFLNREGFVSEATADNLFIVEHGKVFTPPTSDGALPGITRDAVLELCRTSGISAAERHITLADLYDADECFLTGSAAKVVGVAEIDGRTIGSGHCGTVTRRLMDAFGELTRTDGWVIDPSVVSVDATVGAKG